MNVVQRRPALGVAPDAALGTTGQRDGSVKLAWSVQPREHVASCRSRECTAAERDERTQRTAGQPGAAFQPVAASLRACDHEPHDTPVVFP